MFFAKADGTVFVENFEPFKAQIELQDGNHPISNQGIYPHNQRDWPAIMLVWQGVVSPEGESSDLPIVTATNLEADTTKVHKQKPAVSKRWVRSLIRYMLGMIEFVIFSFGIFLIALFSWFFFGLVI